MGFNLPYPSSMSYIRFTPEHLEWLNKHFESKTAEEIPSLVSMSLPNLIQSTSFGATGMVILDMLKKLSIPLPVLIHRHPSPF